jgi:hypothetical protein
MHCILITTSCFWLINKNGAQNEFIFAIAFDGIHTQTYGGTTFLTHAPVGSMDASAFVSMVDGEVSERQQLC